MGGEALTSDEAVATDGLFASLPILLNGEATGSGDLFPSLTNFNPTPAAGATWRESGNLRGIVPVKSEEYPPDIRVVEDQALFDQLMVAVTLAARDQLALATSFMSGPTIVDQRYWFAKSYYRVTMTLLDYVNEGKFYYPSYVLLCMLYFKKVYVDNLNAYNLAGGASGQSASGGACEWQWQVAFSYATPEIGTLINSLVPLSQTPDKALGGMTSALINVMRSAEAHIRFDLSRCAAWIFRSHYPADVIYLSAFEEDFFSMSSLFEATTEEMKTEIYDYTGSWLAAAPTMVGTVNVVDLATEMANGATLAEERIETWERAQDLVDFVGADLKNPYILIHPSGGGLELIGDVGWTNYLAGFDEIANYPTMQGSAALELFMAAVHTP